MVAAPDELVVTDEGTELPREDETARVAPATGLLLASFTETVSATVCPATAELAPPKVNVVPETITLVVLLTPPAVAVIVTVRLLLSALVLNVTLADPEESVVAVLLERVPDEAAKVTVEPEMPPLFASLATAVMVTVPEPLVVNVGVESERASVEAVEPPEEDEDEEDEDEELEQFDDMHEPLPPPPPQATSVAQAALRASALIYCNMIISP